MFLLHQSNRFEALVAGLVRTLDASGADPLDAPAVIVPSLAVRRALQLALADATGICANVHFDFLARWIWARIGALVPVAATSPFAPPRLQWRVLAALGDAAFVDAHPRLARYVERADPPMRLALARRIATLVDHAVTYRPDWLAAWAHDRRVLSGRAEPGSADAHDEAWQAALWRRLLAATGADPRHPALAFFEALDAAAPTGRALPAAIHVFALPAVAPLYLDILQGLAERVDVHYHALNPCREYWFHVVDRKRLADLGTDAAAAHHEVGNALLAAWGRQAQSHLGLVADLRADAIEDDDDWRACGGSTLLHRLQDAILAMRDLAPSSIALADDDRSIEVHVCHSLVRELEALHDRLLAYFAADPGLRPGQIVVACPDLERAAPLIDAVFGVAPPARRIPYAISGRPARSANPVARALAALCALADGRFTASEVFALLEQPGVAARFAMDADELARVRDWLGEAGIRWGAIDEATASRHGFAHGLQRLFASFAGGPDAIVDAAGAGATPVLAAADPEGSDALLLGRLWRFVDAASRFATEARAARPPEAWCARLLDAVNEFVALERDDLDDVKQVRDAIGALRADVRAAGFTGPVPLAVVRQALDEYLDEAARGAVPGGELRFVALGALRALPYRLVCAIGLDDGAYPRAEPAAEFDLVARHPRVGDRQRRHDERNVFLDLVLSAREVLHLSYSGRSIRDDSPLPPSVLVDELLDYLATATASPAAVPDLAAARARLTVEHRLQAFSPVYFLPPDPTRDPRLRSFDATYCNASRARLQARQACADEAVAADTAAAAASAADDDDGVSETRPPFFAAPLPPLAATQRTVSLEALVGFFAQPCRALLDARLAIRLPRARDDIVDDEAFVLDGRGARALGERLAGLAARDASAHALRRIALASPEVPDGVPGARAVGDELHAFAEYAARARLAAASTPRAPLDLSLPLELEGGESWRLEGTLAGLHAGGLALGRFRRLGARERLEAWIRHLALCAAAPRETVRRTIWTARDADLRLLPVADAHAQLARLLTLYRDGMSSPLHFFPYSAWVFVESGGRLDKARGAWTGTGAGGRAEGDDPAYRLALRGVADPLDAAFAAAARAVFGPLHAHLAGAAEGGST